ncbi:FUSC family protein [Streptomyces sp. 6-11-2]|uniref:FUSC family protein n=1 Tax=Streptomyces sp. 6-11-2 TaxID=2585753 RepID=UPI00155AA6BE|nr:FUSC family protein [Streptomyces sp. 6-11-2]
MAASLLLITVFADTHPGAMALFGSLISLWNTNQSLRSRLRRYAAVAPIFPASMALGVWVGPIPWLAISTEALVIFLMAVGYHVFFVGPGPGPIHLFYACAVGTYLGGSTDIGWPIVAVTAVSTALTAVLSLSDLLVRGHHAERKAVAAARAAVHAFLHAAAEEGESRAHHEQRIRRLRTAATAAVDHAASVLGSARSPRARPGPVRHQLGQELHRLDGLLGAGALTRDCPGATAQVGSAPHPGPLGQPSARYLLRRTFGRDPVRLPVLVGLRCACAGLAAGTLALVLHVGHAYWAVLSATIVLHGGLDRNSTVLRAAHRLAGTVAGVLVVSAVEPLQPPAAVHISIIIVSVWGMNLFLPRNYALAASFITVMTLQANIAITSVDATPHLVGQRLLATLIGVAAALVVLVCTGRRMPRRTTQRLLIRTLRATTEVLDHAAAGTSFTEDGWKARRDLRFELLACADLLPRLGADDRNLGQCQDLVDGVQQQAHAALAAGWHAEPDQLDTATRSEEIRSLLDRLPGQRTSAHTPTRGRRIRGNVR